MGTTMRDFLHPEFVLLGADGPDSATKVEAFYATLTDSPICRMSIDSAELTKVAYNTYIGMKIVFANTLMEICHKSPGANVDDVTGALKKAHRRLISPHYLDGGMGDGGGCHPRDNIAMSWLARELPLSHDIFENMMIARDNQTEWLADLMCAHDLPKAIVGYSFKTGTDLTVGSPALLLKAILEERGIHPFLYDPHVEGAQLDLSKLAPHVFLIGAKHPEFTSVTFPKGSVVIDPWRYLGPAGWNDAHPRRHRPTSVTCSTSLIPRSRKRATPMWSARYPTGPARAICGTTGSRWRALLKREQLRLRQLDQVLVEGGPFIFPLELRWEFIDWFARGWPPIS